jgi:hypothetical protein
MVPFSDVTPKEKAERAYDTYHVVKAAVAARRDGVELSDLTKLVMAVPEFAMILQLKPTRPPWYD